MKYICPTCNKEFDIEEEVSKHFLKCWKDNNPRHKSKPAPRSKDINTIEMNNDMMQFFASLGEGDKNERGNDKNTFNN